MKFIERRKDQAIIIDNHLRVTVLEVHDDEVTISIESGDDPSANRIETLRLANAQTQLELVGV